MFVQYLVHDDTERSSVTNGTAGLSDCAFPKGMMGATTAMVALEARISRAEVVARSILRRKEVVMWMLLLRFGLGSLDCRQ